MAVGDLYFNTKHVRLLWNEKHIDPNIRMRYDESLIVKDSVFFLELQAPTHHSDARFFLSLSHGRTGWLKDYDYFYLRPAENNEWAEDIALSRG